MEIVDWTLVRLTLRMSPGFSEEFMTKKSMSVLQSRKTVGYLWLLAGVLMMLPSVFSDGHETTVGVGIMFLILGIVFLNRERKN